MATGSLDFLLPLITLVGMGAVLAAVGLFIRMRGRRLIVDDGVLLVSTDFAGFADVRWGGPDQRRYETRTLYVGPPLATGARVKVRHRPDRTDEIEILGPNVRGVYLFWVAGVTAGLGVVLAVIVYLTS